MPVSSNFAAVSNGDVLQRAIAAVSLCLFDLAHNIHPICHLSKDHMLACATTTAC